MSTDVLQCKPETEHRANDIGDTPLEGVDCSDDPSFDDLLAYTPNHLERVEDFEVVIRAQHQVFARIRARNEFMNLTEVV